MYTCFRTPRRSSSSAASSIFGALQGFKSSRENLPSSAPLSDGSLLRRVDRLKPAFFEFSPDPPDDFEESPLLIPFVLPTPDVPDRPSSPTLPTPPSSSTDSPPPPPSPPALPAPPTSQCSSGSSPFSSTSSPAVRPAILRRTKSGRTVRLPLRFRL
ncbi:UNVERIFIED_CONTAM: hypothetical protein RMT77_001362 [Armadillidium vulgare]